MSPPYSIFLTGMQFAADKCPTSLLILNSVKIITQFERKHNFKNSTKNSAELCPVQIDRLMIRTATVKAPVPPAPTLPERRRATACREAAGRAYCRRLRSRTDRYPPAL